MVVANSSLVWDRLTGLIADLQTAIVEAADKNIKILDTDPVFFKPVSARRPDYFMKPEEIIAWTEFEIDAGSICEFVCDFPKVV